MKLSARQQSGLRQVFSSFCPLEENALNQIVDLFSLSTCHTGEYLLRAGDIANKFAFVETGLFREYFVLENGDEFNKSFIKQGEFTGSLYDLLSHEPSTANIVALENSQIFIASYADFRKLFDIYPCCQKLGRLIAERLFQIKARREYEFLTMNAEDRYIKLLETYPNIEERVAQYQLASYLGITPVALSRLRTRAK